MKKTYEMQLTVDTTDFIVSLARQAYIEIDGVRHPWGEVHRLAAVPGDFDAVENLLKDTPINSSEEIAAVRGDAGITSADMRISPAHPFMTLFKALWTDEVVAEYEERQKLEVRSQKSEIR